MSKSAESMFVAEYQTLNSGAVLRLRMRGTHYDGEVNVSRDGVSLLGRWPSFNRAMLLELKAAIDFAAETYKVIDNASTVHHPTICKERVALWNDRGEARHG